MQRLYCYVDETGQDTLGRLFLVASVIVGNEREAIADALRAIEQRTGKGRRKWFHTSRPRRARYIEEILASGLFRDSLFYSRYEDSRAYVDLMILSVAKAILVRATEPYQVTVLVDGLGRTERHRFGAGLRRLRVRVRKVRGLRDESDAFIRLADAVAGFVRDHLEGDPLMKELYEAAWRQGVVREV